MKSRRNTLANQAPLNEWLSQHSIGVSIASGVCLVLILNAGRREVAPVPRFGVLSWIALIYDLIAVLAVSLYPRITKASRRDTLFILLAYALAPALLGFVSTMAGGPDWVLELGAATSLLLVLATFALERKAASTTDPAPGTSRRG